MAGRGSVAGRRYAEAAFELATRDGALDAYGDGLDLAARLLGGDEVLAIVRNPARSLAERLAFADDLLRGHVPEVVERLARLLVANGRIDRLAGVAAEYRRLL